MTPDNLANGHPHDIVWLEKYINWLKEYVDKQFELRDRALVAASETTTARFEAGNAVRESLRDQATHFITRVEHDTLCSQVSELKEWRSRQEGKASQSSVTMATLIAFAGLALAAVGLIVSFVR